MGVEASREGREAIILCLQYFFGSTEKQDVRDLSALSRTRDPGEGELEVCVQGWEVQRSCWVGPGGGQKGENMWGEWGETQGHRFQMIPEGFVRVTGPQMGPGIRLVWARPETPALIVGPANELNTHASWALSPQPPGCYFDGDRSWRAAGTRWHPVVPPFGLIKCAVCTCKVWLPNPLWCHNPAGSAEMGRGLPEGEAQPF